MRSVIRYSNRLDGVLDQNNLPWLLTEQQSNYVKEFIQRIKFSTGFASNDAGASPASSEPVRKQKTVGQVPSTNFEITLKLMHNLK